VDEQVHDLRPQAQAGARLARQGRERLSPLDEGILKRQPFEGQGLLRRQERRSRRGLLREELAFLDLDVDDEVLRLGLAQEDLEPLEGVGGGIELVSERPEEPLAGLLEEALPIEDGQDFGEGITPRKRELPCLT